MADQIGKTYEPEVIEDAPFPNENISEVSLGGGESGVYTPKTTKEKTFPTKRVAVELLSTALNTRSKKILQSFEFTQSGAIQIGKYEDGITGDIRISPNGIVGRDSSGNTTFSLDATTGDAVFSGTIQGASLLTGSLVVGDNGVIIDGDTRTIIVNDGTYDRVLIGYDAGGF